VVREDQEEYFSNWITSPWLPARLPTFDGDYEALGAEFRLRSRGRSQHAVFLLERLAWWPHRSGLRGLDNHLHSGENWRSGDQELPEGTMELASRSWMPILPRARHLDDDMNIDAETLED